MVIDGSVEPDELYHALHRPLYIHYVSTKRSTKNDPPSRNIDPGSHAIQVAYYYRRIKEIDERTGALPSIGVETRRINASIR
jgi:hypothetical protein